MSSHSISIPAAATEASRPKTRKRQELRKFGLTLGVAVIGFLGLLMPLLASKPLPIWPWYLGGVLIFLGLVFPAALEVPSNIWMKIGHVLGFINTRILLSVIFFVMLCPMSLVKRLRMRDPLGLRYDPNARSYRVIRDNPPTAKNMEEPF